MVSSPRGRDGVFSVMPMAPPDPFQQISAMNTSHQVTQPYPTIQKTSGILLNALLRISESVYQNSTNNV